MAVNKSQWIDDEADALIEQARDIASIGGESPSRVGVIRAALREFIEDRE
jgi:hypothetical protein